METIVTAGIIVFLAIIGLATGFLIKALIQLRITLRSVELLTDNLNAEVLQFQKISGAAANVASALSGSVGRTASLAFSVVNTLLKSRRTRRRSEEDGGSGNGR
jgi:hypothetical protein